MKMVKKPSITPTNADNANDEVVEPCPKKQKIEKIDNENQNEKTSRSDAEIKKDEVDKKSGK